MFSLMEIRSDEGYYLNLFSGKLRVQSWSLANPSADGIFNEAITIVGRGANQVDAVDNVIANLRRLVGRVSSTRERFFLVFRPSGIRTRSYARIRSLRCDVTPNPLVSPFDRRSRVVVRGITLGLTHRGWTDSMDVTPLTIDSPANGVVGADNVSLGIQGTSGSVIDAITTSSGNNANAGPFPAELVGVGDDSVIIRSLSKFYSIAIPVSLPGESHFYLIETENNGAFTPASKTDDGEKFAEEGVITIGFEPLWEWTPDGEYYRIMLRKTDGAGSLPILISSGVYIPQSNIVSLTPGGDNASPVSIAINGIESDMPAQVVPTTTRSRISRVWLGVDQMNRNLKSMLPFGDGLEGLKQAIDYPAFSEHVAPISISGSPSWTSSMSCQIEADGADYSGAFRVLGVAGLDPNYYSLVESGVLSHSIRIWDQVSEPVTDAMHPIASVLDFGTFYLPQGSLLDIIPVEWTLSATEYPYETGGNLFVYGLVLLPWGDSSIVTNGDPLMSKDDRYMLPFANENPDIAYEKNLNGWRKRGSLLITSGSGLLLRSPSEICVFCSMTMLDDNSAPAYGYDHKASVHLSNAGVKRLYQTILGDRV